jgi:hypothetical protein
MVASAILLIVVLALVASYSAFYGRIAAVRIATVGQNLAQLQLEDLRGMGKAQLAALVNGGSVPPNYAEETSTDGGSGYNVSTVYDAGIYDGTYYLSRIAEINGHSPSGAGDIPPLTLPPGVIDVSVVPQSDGATSWYDYTVILHRQVFPGYRRRVRIVDRAPSVSESGNKEFTIEVTVYWTIGPVTKSYTARSET